MAQPRQGRATCNSGIMLSSELVEAFIGPSRLMRDDNVDAGQIGGEEQGLLPGRVLARDG